MNKSVWTQNICFVAVLVLGRFALLCFPVFFLFYFLFFSFPFSFSMDIIKNLEVIHANPEQKSIKMSKFVEIIKINQDFDSHMMSTY